MRSLPLPSILFVAARGLRGQRHPPGQAGAGDISFNGVLVRFEGQVSFEIESDLTVGCGTGGFSIGGSDGSDGSDQQSLIVKSFRRPSIIIGGVS